MEEASEIAQFRIVRLLGRGGMGEVWLARDREVGGDVALKRLATATGEDLLRLKREFRVLADLSHPNLVQLYDLVGVDGSWFFTMEVVHGVGFSLDPNHPNVVAPGKRPFHTIIPGFAMDGAGKPLMAFGVMGGPMQAQGHVQMAVRILRYGQNPQAAADAPRWRFGAGRQVFVEPTFPPHLVEGLRARGHDIRVESADGVFAFGGAQAIFNAFGGGPTCIGYWRLNFAASAAGIALWEEIAAEHQARQRGNSAECEVSRVIRLA